MSSLKERIIWTAVAGWVFYFFVFVGSEALGNRAGALGWVIAFGPLGLWFLYWLITGKSFMEKIT